MSKKIHTIQSSDKKKFDEQVNELLELGCELMDGGYQVINNDDGVVYSQVIVFKKNCEVEFYEDGQLKSVRNDRIQTSWYENGQKKEEETYKNGEIDGLHTLWYEDGQKRSEGTYKDGNLGLWTSWYDNGQKKEEKTYKDGEIDGLSTKWYENGHKEKEENFKNGIEHG